MVKRHSLEALDMVHSLCYFSCTYDGGGGGGGDCTRVLEVDIQILGHSLVVVEETSLIVHQKIEVSYACSGKE